MKIDHYMPFFGKDFFGAMEGFREIVVSSYIRALWHYWQHTHCRGLRDDSDYLRVICHCDDLQWEYVYPILFGDGGELFYRDRSGLWQQDRARTEYLMREHIYEARSAGGKAAAGKRWANIPPPPRKPRP